MYETTLNGHRHTHSAAGYTVDPDVETGMMPEVKMDDFEVVFQGHEDKLNPQNWPIHKKVFQTILITIATFCAGSGSAVLEGGIRQIESQLGASPVLASFSNTIFVVGFALGPQLFGPTSKVYGRKWPLTSGIFVASIFAIQCALAPNLTTLLVGRFLSGVFSAAPYAIGGGIFHDIYDAVHVQGGIAFFAAATAGGPAWGPIIGTGLATTGDYGWRWISWFMLAFGIFVTVLLSLFMDESYSPVILSRIAAKKRKETGMDQWWAPLDRVVITPRDMLVRYLFRPVRMLFTEPILLVVSIYMSFVYGLLYMLMAALPIIYGEMRGMTAMKSTLPLIAVFVGIVCGGGIIILDLNRYKRKLVAANAPTLPEQRFVPMGLGAVLLPIGLFWFAFTGPAQTSSPWPSIIALGFSMCGMILIFECGIIYLIDTYGAFANSAIAANTLMRSLVGGGFPLFTPAMVHNLGYSATWSMFLLACIALVLAGIPAVFFYTGARIRAKSSFKLEL